MKNSLDQMVDPEKCIPDPFRSLVYKSSKSDPILEQAFEQRLQEPTKRQEPLFISVEKLKARTVGNSYIRYNL